MTSWWFPLPGLLILLLGAALDLALIQLDAGRIRSAEGIGSATRSYLIDSARESALRLISVSLAQALFFGLGGIVTCDRLAFRAGERLGLDEVGIGVLFFGILTALRMAVRLPFEIRHVFGLEARHGFNRTTPRTFVLDHFKSIVLLVLIGAPVGYGVLKVFQISALLAWAAWMSFELFFAWIAPAVLLPLFVKLEALPPGTLNERIAILAKRMDFPFSRVYLMDGSRRSSKANAFFAGFGLTRKIVLFDTLVQKLSEDEILAVLAHEIGHWKLRHVPKRMIAGNLVSLAGFTMAGFLWPRPVISALVGIDDPRLHTGLIGLALLAGPISLALGFLGSTVSRRHEYEADRFAREAFAGDPAPLISGLTRLAEDHKSHPDPHPLNVALHYSHPTLRQRVAALQSSGH